MVFEHAFQGVAEIGPTSVHFAESVGSAVHIAGHQKGGSQQDVDSAEG